MVFLKEFFEKVDFEKSPQMTTKACKIIQHAKSFNGFIMQKPPLNTHADLDPHQLSQESINFEKFRPPEKSLYLKIKWVQYSKELSHNLSHKTVLLDTQNICYN